MSCYLMDDHPTQVTAMKMLQTGLGYNYLYDHCAREYSTENIVCWKKIEDFKAQPAPSVTVFEVGGLRV